MTTAQKKQPIPKEFRELYELVAELREKQKLAEQFPSSVVIQNARTLARKVDTQLATIRLTTQQTTSRNTKNPSQGGFHFLAR